MSDDAEKPPAEDAAPTRRRLLMLGAASASAVITIRPALANTAASVLNCQIPVPDPGHDGQWIAPDGSLVSVNTPGAFAPPVAPLKGEDVKAALNSGRPYPGAPYDASKAYTNYIRRLQRGTRWLHLLCIAANAARLDFSDDVPVYRAVDPLDLAPPVKLDDFTLIYHRSSGATHLLAEPVPEILAVLAEGPATIAGIVGRLARDHELVDEGDVAPAIMACLGELEALGLVVSNAA